MHAYRCKIVMYANFDHISVVAKNFWTLSEKPCRNPIFVRISVATLGIVHGLNRTQTQCIQLERDKPCHTVTIPHFPSQNYAIIEKQHDKPWQVLTYIFSGTVGLEVTILELWKKHKSYRNSWCPKCHQNLMSDDK